MVAITAAIAALTGPSYEAKTTVRLATPTTLSTRPIQPDAIEYADRLENTYAQLLESQQSRVELQQRLGLPHVPVVRVDARPNTELFDVVGRADTPWAALTLSEAGSALLLERVAELGQESIRTSDALFEERIAELEAQLAADRARRRSLLGKKAPALVAERQLLLNSIRTDEAALIRQRSQYERERLARGERVETLTIVAPAQLPQGEASPSLRMLIGVGLIVGLIGGLGLAFLLDSLRPQRHSPTDLEDMLEVPVLGHIPADAELRRDGSTAWADALRHLRTTVIANLDDLPGHAILLTGSGDASRHGAIGANLARSLAEAGKTVVLVDGNIRSPVLERHFDVDPDAPGLLDILRRRCLPADAVSPGPVSGVSLLPAGHSDERSVELLSADEMGELITSLQARFDVVLIVGPSLDSSPDALTLAAVGHAAVLMVEWEETSLGVLRAIRSEFRRVHARVLGLILDGQTAAAAPAGITDGSRVEYA